MKNESESKEDKRQIEDEEGFFETFFGHPSESEHEK